MYSSSTGGDVHMQLQFLNFGNLIKLKADLSLTDKQNYMEEKIINIHLSFY